MKTVMTFARIFLNAKKPFKLYDKLYKNIVYYLFNTASLIYCELFKIDMLFFSSTLYTVFVNSIITSLML